MAKNIPSPGSLTPEEFVIRAIERLRTPPYRGIHSVFSGFNAAFREYFPNLNPVEFTNQMAEEGKIVIRPVKKGVRLYKAGEEPSTTRVSETLRKILE